MNPIASFLLELSITLLICLLIVIYFRLSLQRILKDLCGTEESARFWTVFCSILLVGLPMIFSLGYHPGQLGNEAMFFDVAEHLSLNLAAFLLAFFGIGVVISFFALVAPRPNKIETK